MGGEGGGREKGCGGVREIGKRGGGGGGSRARVERE